MEKISQGQNNRKTREKRDGFAVYLVWSILEKIILVELLLLLFFFIFASLIYGPYLPVAHKLAKINSTNIFPVLISC